MITLHNQAVRVLSADLALREATVSWTTGRVRVVPIFSLRGTRGGDLEVVAVCREAEKRARSAEGSAR